MWGAVLGAEVGWASPLSRRLWPQWPKLDSQPGLPICIPKAYGSETEEMVSLFSFPDAGLHLSVFPNLASGERTQREKGLGNEITVNISSLAGTPLHRPTAELTNVYSSQFIFKSDYWFLELSVSVTGWFGIHSESPMAGFGALRPLNCCAGLTDSLAVMGTQTTLVGSHQGVL